MDTRHATTPRAAERKINLTDAPTGPQGERLLAAGERLGMRLWVEERPVDGPLATREHETVGFALQGRATLTLGDRRVELLPGDSWVVPAGVPHAYRISESFAAVEATAPPPRAAERLELRDSGATMGTQSEATVARTDAMAGRAEPAAMRTAATRAVGTSSELRSEPGPTVPRTAIPAAPPAPARSAMAVTPAGYAGPEAHGAPPPDATSLLRRHVRRHELARRVRGTPAQAFALLRGADGPERWLPAVPVGRDYVRFVGQDRRLEWGASDDSWQAWFDAHTVRGDVIALEAQITTAYDLDDPRAPSASAITGALRVMLDAIGDALQHVEHAPVGEATRAAIDERNLTLDGQPHGDLRRF